MRRLPASLVALLAVVIPLTACGDDGDDVGTDGGSATTAPAEDPIAGRTFEATSLESDTQALVEGVTLRISFTDDQITVETGCNRLSGTYAVEGPILVVEGLGGTEMGCEPELMTQEAWIADALTTRPVVTGLPPDGLLLSGEGWALTMAAPDEETDDLRRALPGSTWTLDTLIGGESASSVPEGVEATVVFSGDGGLQVAAGCNTGTGGYSTPDVDGSIVVDPPGLTRRRCDEAAMEVEAAVVAVLDGRVEVTIDGDRLTLTAASGAGLSFTTAA